MRAQNGRKTTSEKLEVWRTESDENLNDCNNGENFELGTVKLRDFTNRFNKTWKITLRFWRLTRYNCYSVMCRGSSRSIQAGVISRLNACCDFFYNSI